VKALCSNPSTPAPPAPPKKELKFWVIFICYVYIHDWVGRASEFLELDVLIYLSVLHQNSICSIYLPTRGNYLSS
jgi:hypothetical protein